MSESYSILIIEANGQTRVREFLPLISVCKELRLTPGHTQFVIWTPDRLVAVYNKSGAFIMPNTTSDERNYIETIEGRSFTLPQL